MAEPDAGPSAPSASPSRAAQQVDRTGPPSFDAIAAVRGSGIREPIRGTPDLFRREGRCYQSRDSPREISFERDVEILQDEHALLGFALDEDLETPRHARILPPRSDRCEDRGHVPLEQVEGEGPRLLSFRHLVHPPAIAPANRLDHLQA